ncbi:MAG: cobalamin-dependent protein, partial [Candidatus Methanomethylophilaceae archaeon]|nr:cobalamin-dependent protein [Candidatus Methanomethylophilaceae archaeon]
MSDNEQILKDLKQSVETWDQSLMESSVKQALNAKIPFDVIISEGLGKGMETINDMFNEAKIFLPQIMAASKTMQSALMMIEPTLVDDKDIYRGTIIMGSVQGDIHEIGKNVCCAMLRGAGYKVYDLGSDVPPDLFVEEAQKNDADIIGGSALMTTTLVMQKNIVRSV